MDEKNETPTTKPEVKSLCIPIRMPLPLAEKLQNAAERTHLSQQDVARLAIDRGIDILLKQLTGEVAA